MIIYIYIYISTNDSLTNINLDNILMVLSKFSVALYSGKNTKNLKIKLSKIKFVLTIFEMHSL